MSDKLKPCPACDGEELNKKLVRSSLYQIECWDCGMEGPIENSVNPCGSKWNAMPRKPELRPMGEAPKDENILLYWLDPMRAIDEDRYLDPVVGGWNDIMDTWKEGYSEPDKWLPLPDISEVSHG